MRRNLFAAVLMLFVIGGGVLAYLDSQHSFDLRSETFSFDSGGNTFAATLHLPITDGPHGLVVFVPGDGTTDADPGAMPVWEALGRAGYATVKWDKPGVGASTGNWLDQDMSDRADEVVDVVAALAGHEEVDVSDLGVMGISQGGWVIPLVAEQTEVDFFIAWSTAIDWTEQGGYLTERELVNSGADDELVERVRAAGRSDRGDTYDDYVDWHDALDPDVAAFFSDMTEDRWEFVVRNQGLDARETLPAMENTPVLLILGEEDDNVDVDDTERVYQEILGGPFLEVIRYPGADHNLLDHEGVGLTLVGTFRPRNIFADGMLDDIERFAGDHE